MKKKTNLSKGKQELLAFLGDPYKEEIIDLEPCVCLEMGNHEIEISGGNTQKQKFNIYVWNKPATQIVERYFDVAHDFKEVKSLLDTIASKYQ